jgi:uncharacterized protein YdaU (DUF1376 family)
MNYYPFHVGDYASHTGHLDPIEDLAYRRLLDAYYLRESPLPADIEQTARLIRMRNNDMEVEAVLNEFFLLTDTGWSHARCDEEIAKMQDKQAKARASAQASVTARKAKANPMLNDGQADTERTLNERSADVELPTPIPTPTPIKEYICPPEGEPEGELSSFPGCNHQAVISLYHQHLPTLRKVEVWNTARQGYLRQRWREVAADISQSRPATHEEILDWWAGFFQHINKSKFLTGKVNSKDGRAFLADLEWIIKPSNFAKIVEGKYHGT